MLGVCKYDACFSSMRKCILVRERDKWGEGERVCIYIYIYIHIYICIHVRIYRLPYIFMYTYIHTYINTYICTYKMWCSQESRVACLGNSSYMTRIITCIHMCLPHHRYVQTDLWDFVSMMQFEVNAYIGSYAYI